MYAAVRLVSRCSGYPDRPLRFGRIEKGSVREHARIFEDVLLLLACH